METLNTLAEKPGSKPMVYIAAKWSGIPGGQQVYKILKQMAREEKQEQKMMRRAADPASYMKREMRKENPYYQQKKEMMKKMRGY